MKTELERRYEQDSEFSAACDLMYALAVKHQFTPSELRDIAFMAAMRYEMIHGFKKITVALNREEYERIKHYLSDPPDAYRPPYSVTGTAPGK